jgi:hypothetical protein
MSLLPPSTNHLYSGSLASVWFLGLYGLLELGTGCVHYLLPELVQHCFCNSPVCS